MTDKIVNFYKRIITGIGFSYDEENYIRMGTDPKVSSIFIMDGKSLVLPTQDHIRTSTQVKENGEIDVVKILYNPMYENAVRIDSPSLIITKRAAESKLGVALATAGSLLLTIAENDKLHDKLSLDVSKFLSSLTEDDDGGKRKLVDKKSVDTWIKMCNLAISGETRIISMYVAKAGKYKDIKYNRLSKLDSPLYALLKTATPDTSIYTLKLRPKDIKSFNLIFKYLLPDLEEDGTISSGSNDKECPAFISLMQLYLSVSGWLNKIITDMANINEEKVDEGKITIDVTAKELENLSIYHGELKLIPNEATASRPVLITTPPAAETLTRGIQPMVAARVPLEPRPLVEPTIPVTGNPDKDFLNRMYGNRGPDVRVAVPQANAYQGMPGFGYANTQQLQQPQQGGFGYSSTQKTGGFGNSNPNSAYANPFGNNAPQQGRSRF